MKIEEFEDFQIECLGEIEEWVYDIEVEDNHNFFANDILVHNSVYVTLDGLVKQLIKQKGELPAEKVVDFIDTFCHKIIEPKLAEIYNNLANYMNAYVNTMVMKQEKISECFHPNSYIDHLGMTIEEYFRIADSEIEYLGNTELKEVSEKTKSYNIKSKKLENDEIYAVMRKKYSGYMYRFESDAGKVIEVTEDHLLAIECGDCIIYKKAKEINESDRLIFN